MRIFIAQDDIRFLLLRMTSDSYCSGLQVRGGKPKRGFAAYFVFREMGGPGSPGLRLGLSFDARCAG